MRCIARASLCLSACFVAAHAAHAQCDERWIGGQPLTGIEGTPYTSCEWDPDGPGPAPSQLIVGGFFKFAGDRYVSSIASFDGMTWRPLGDGLSNPIVRDGLALVSAAIPFQNKLVVSGWFDRSGSTPLNSVAMWDGTRWTPMGAGFDARAKAFTIHNGELYAGGGFIRSGDQEVICVARWDGTRWRDLDRGLDGLVTGLVSFQGRLIACGDFGATANGAPVLRLAAWNGSRWSPVTDDLRNADGGIVTVSAVTVFNNELINSGIFDIVGGVSARGVAAWNGTRWASVGPGTSGIIYAVEPFGDDLAAGGSFLQIGSVPNANGVAAWRGGAWSPLGPGFNDTVFDLNASSGSLFAAGAFTRSGASTTNGVAQWNGTAWCGLGSGLSGKVLDLEIHQGSLHAAGSFAFTGRTAVKGIALGRHTLAAPRSRRGRTDPTGLRPQKPRRGPLRWRALLLDRGCPRQRNRVVEWFGMASHVQRRAGHVPLCL
jgi:hypothetical protein